MRLSVMGGTDRGRRRELNEDAFLIVDMDDDRKGDRLHLEVGEAGVLLAVSDGLGGAPHGEVASATTVHALYDELKTVGVRGDERKLLSRVVSLANNDVVAAAQRPSRAGMGATLTAALVRRGIAFLAHVGDSRGYLLRDENLRRITHDQSFVQMLVDQGHLTQAQAEHHPQKNVVLQVMGQETPVRAEVGSLAVRSGDRLLLCSDGLFNAIEDDEIAALLAGENAVRELIDAANAAGGPDNVTVVVALVG